MSESAVILEGEVARRFNPVDKLRATNQDSSVSDWVPSDTLDLGSLMASENNLYLANLDDDCDAYEEVEVDVSTDLEDADDLTKATTKITGKDPDSGETLEVGLDEDGNLMEQVLPDHIKIVVLPAKRHYQEGDILDFSGIHVYLMNAGTSRFTCEQYPTGEIPYSELIFPVTNAEGSGVGHKIATIDGVGSIPFIETSSMLVPDSFGRPEEDLFVLYTKDGQAISPKCYIFSSGFLYAYFDSKFTGQLIIRRGLVIKYGTADKVGTTSSSGKDIYCFIIGTLYWVNSNATPKPPILSEQYTNQQIIDILYDGTITEDDNDIPVQWMRSDGEILEDTFPITVGGEAPEPPEPMPDPYEGQCDFVWQGKKYCFNKSLARCEVMYSDGTVWQTWLGGQSPPYTVDQALKLKLIVQVGWSGGGSTSGSF